MSTVELTSRGPNSYDLLPYPSGSFPQTQPNVLAGMGQLFGLAMTPPSKARVLELGCANGANLLPMADRARGSHFVGIDGAKVQIAAGREALVASGLNNVELRQQDILDFSPAEGKFDYIIAHGIFSWVPEEVRRKILEICSANLTENGVAYVSYNALPGWNMRKSLRDMVQFHTDRVEGMTAKVEQIRALVKFMAESVPTENNAHGMFLKQELGDMSREADGYLFHELLEPENTAFYFSDFVARAARHGLQYLGEPSLPQMFAASFPVHVAETLRQIARDVVTQEQYMDFLRNRRFRETLLCHASRKINRQVETSSMTGFSFETTFQRLASSLDLTPGVVVRVETAAGPVIRASDPFVKATLQVLTETAPAALSYGQILNAARRLAEPWRSAPPANQNETDAVTLQAYLMDLTVKGLVRVLAEPVSIAAEPPVRPELSPLTRYQATHCRVATSLLHRGAILEPIWKTVMAACDGTRTQGEILDVVVAEVRQGRLQVNEDGHPVTNEKKVRELMAAQVSFVLSGLASAGFFQGPSRN